LLASGSKFISVDALAILYRGRKLSFKSPLE
jgi:hypothetical protein